MADIKQFSDQIFESVKTYIVRNLTPIMDRLKELDGRITAIPAPQKGDPGSDGKDGVDGKNIGHTEVEQMVQRAAAALPKPVDGKDGDPGSIGPIGPPGKDADSVQIAKDVLEKVTLALDQIPAPKDGKDGAKGDKGDAGDVGPIGPGGAAGNDADPEIVKALVLSEVHSAVELIPVAKDGKDAEPVDTVAIVADVLSKLPEPVKGDQGDRGPQGDRGADGLSIKGDVGDKGDKGDRGESGIGVKGDKGEDGLTVKGDPGDPGRDGRDGEPGRDAVHVDVLDAVDPVKRYQRGTFATHRGGLIRSFKATDPLPPGADLERSGWHVVVRGIDEVGMDMSEDCRTITMRMAYTDGTAVQKTFKSPAVIDRGVWQELAYEHGDSVTWGGCTHTAQRDTLPTEKPTDESGAWRMSNKKGRDGRDGLKGDKGDRGAEGRAGKDLTSMALDGAKYR